MDVGKGSWRRVARNAPWSMREHERGLDLSDVTIGQEHFSGSFSKSRRDENFYAVAVHNHISVVEVQGFEDFKRLGGTLSVTSLEGRDPSLALACDETNLYVCFTVNGLGPLLNMGNDWRRLFKTGAAVDLQIGLDPKAEVERRTPGRGGLPPAHDDDGRGADSSTLPAQCAGFAAGGGMGNAHPRGPVRL